MSLITALEKLAYAPLSTSNQALQYLTKHDLKNNQAITEQLVKELSNDKLDISYDLFACETHVVAIR